MLTTDPQNLKLKFKIKEITVECLLLISGVYHKNYYIPGETRNNNALR